MGNKSNTSNISSTTTVPVSKYRSNNSYRKFSSTGQSYEKVQDRYYSDKEYAKLSYEDKGTLKRLRDKRGGDGNNKESGKKVKWGGGQSQNDVRRQIAAMQSKLDGRGEQETDEAEETSKRPGILNNRTNNALTRQSGSKGKH